MEPSGYLQSTLYTGSFVGENYAQISEGFQLEQSINQYVGVFCRLTAFQIFQNQTSSGTVAIADSDGEISGFLPLVSPSAQLFFGRFQGGLDFYLTPTTNLQLSGGSDAGSDSSPLFEADFSSWLFVHRLHPLQLSVSSIFTFQNQSTSNSINLETLVRSTENWMFMAGVGGAIFNSSFISGANTTTILKNEGEGANGKPFMIKVGGAGSSLDGQGGVDVDAYYRPLQSGVGIQMGYGTTGVYGEIALSMQINLID
jgi:hypothetical protein